MANKTQNIMPKCTQKLRNCVNCHNGYCKALTDTTFMENGKRYKCPFYKTRIEYAMQLQELKRGKYEFR